MTISVLNFFHIMEKMKLIRFYLMTQPAQFVAAASTFPVPLPELAVVFEAVGSKQVVSLCSYMSRVVKKRGDCVKSCCIISHKYGLHCIRVGGT